MTTDITNTETITQTAAQEANMTPMEYAEDFIKTHSILELADQLVTYSESCDNMRNTITRKQLEIDNLRNNLRNVVDTVTEFLKSHISENDSASVDELKELAEELDIELTKSITVKIEIEVEVEMTVPLDFDEESIDDSDFDISCEFNGMTDVEVDDTNIEVTSCEVEED